MLVEHGESVRTADAHRRFDQAMQWAVGVGLAVALALFVLAALLGRSLYPGWWWTSVFPLSVLLVGHAVGRCLRGALTRRQLGLLVGGVAVFSTATAAAVGDAVPDVGTAVLPVVVVVVLGLGFLAPPQHAVPYGVVVIVAGAVLPGALRPEELPAFLTQAAIQALILLATTTGGGAARRVLAAEERAEHELMAAVAADRTATALRTYRRELRRRLHDTVLNTFAALDRGHLSATEEVRSRCAADARFLRTRLEQGGVGDEVRWTQRLADVVAAMRADGLGVELVGTAVRTDAVPGHVGVAVSRAAGQALSNVQRHSGTRRARVEYEGDASTLMVRIIDRGRGPGPSDAEGLGVRRSVRERMEDVHGAAEITAHPVSGTVVTLRWPR